MSVISQLRQLRHGSLKCLDPFWVVAGRFYRRLMSSLPAQPAVEHYIGRYGPFKLHGEFSFSDFQNWGQAHNKGFDACIEACEDKKCIIDIGAHIGLVSLPASSVIAPEGRVYAFEPAQSNRDYLDYHLYTNNIENVEICPYLVGAKNETNAAFNEDIDAANGMNSVAPLGSNKGNFSRNLCQQITLDTFCEERDIKPDVIKIDVEGAEIGVLQGAQDIIMRCKPTIFLSIHPGHIKRMGQDINQLTEIIASIGYKVHAIDGSRVDEFRLDEYILKPKDSGS